MKTARITVGTARITVITARIAMRKVPENLTFDIDLIFVGNVTEDQKELFRQAARRWEAIITSDIPDQKIVRDSDSEEYGFV